MERSPAGFWSYVHKDNDGENGRIRRLAQLIKDEYGLLTEEELTLFLDRDIKWGEAWRERIDAALAETTFFIPVITPRYFASQECRKELLQFVGHAKSLGLEELLLPLYYISVPRLEKERENSTDEAIALIASIQRYDWRELRLEDEDSAAYRKGVNGLAARLAEIAAEISTRGITPVEARAAEPEEGEGPPGLVELVAEAEDAIPKVGAALEQLPQEMERVAGITADMTPKLQRAAGKGAAKALVVFRQIARELTEPASRIREVGREYAAELIRVDPAVLALLRYAESGLWSKEDALELVANVHELHRAAQGALPAMRDLVAILDQVGGLSRDLRVPLGDMREGVRYVMDGQAVLDEWERRANEVEAAVADDAGSDDTSPSD